MAPNFHLIIYPSSIIIIRHQHPRAGRVIDIHPHRGWMDGCRYVMDRKRIFRGGRAWKIKNQRCTRWMKIEPSSTKRYTYYTLLLNIVISLSWLTAQLNSGLVWSPSVVVLYCMCMPVPFLLLYALLYYFVLAGQCNYPSLVGRPRTPLLIFICCFVSHNPNISCLWLKTHTHNSCIGYTL